MSLEIESRVAVATQWLHRRRADLLERSVHFFTGVKVDVEVNGHFLALPKAT